MANWCSNRVEFIGEHSQFEQLASLFQAMAEKEKKEERGQLPPFADQEDGGHFFWTSWEDGILYYETKWSPNTDVLRLIADEYRVGLIHSYNETGNCVFGETHYIDQIVTDFNLDFDDFAQYEYNEDNGMYHFEGISYESNEEILEILLARKKAALKHQDLNPTDND